MINKNQFMYLNNMSENLIKQSNYYAYSYSFVFQKDCPTGKLNKKKFIDVYKQFYPSGKADKFCEYVFRTFDNDSSGTIGR